MSKTIFHDMFSAMVKYMYLYQDEFIKNSTQFLIKERKIEGEDGDFTKNVVFKDILLSQ